MKSAQMIIATRYFEWRDVNMMYSFTEGLLTHPSVLLAVSLPLPWRDKDGPLCPSPVDCSPQCPVLPLP